MAIDKIDKQLDTVDSIFTKLGTIIKKHWWVILIGLVAWFFYWPLTTEFEEEYYEPTNEEYYDESL
jgi:protein-S-isoprenylcysteine O-methyltransferase Ste14